MIELPPALESAWSTHGYYGSVSHNVKAIYQRYMGWFDGNPARLWPHPPAEQARALRRGDGRASTASSSSRRRRSTRATSAGRRRCSTTRSSPTRTTPRPASCYADTLEQLGYGAENGTWRNFFLSGATELRDGNFGTPTATVRARDRRPAHARAAASTRSRSRSNGPKAWDLDLSINVTFTDLDADLPGHAAQRRADLPQGGRRSGRRGIRLGGEDAPARPHGRRPRLAGPRRHRRRVRSCARAARRARAGRPVVQHRHAREPRRPLRSGPGT